MISNHCFLASLYPINKFRGFTLAFGKNGYGRITQYSLVGLVSPQKIVKTSNSIQKFFIEETRLGIPIILQSESLVGYPGKEGTIFPSMLNLAATWNLL